MPESPRKIDKPKVIAGAILICAGALMMLLGQDSASPLFKTIWVGLLGLGIFFYLRGRFFSREDKEMNSRTRGRR